MDTSSLYLSSDSESSTPTRDGGSPALPSAAASAAATAHKRHLDKSLELSPPPVKVKRWLGRVSDYLLTPPNGRHIYITDDASA